MANIDNVPIAVTIEYNTGVLVGGLLTYSFSIDLGQLVDGQLQDPINMKVLSTLTNGQTAYLVYGVDYIATPNIGYPTGGITVTLLKFITNGDTLYFTRYTAANYNTDFTTLINQSYNYADRQNVVYNNIYDILQEEQLATQNLQEAIVNLIPWSAVGVPFGVAPLNSLAVVPLQNLPFSLFTPVGNWDASTNTPFLTAGTGTPGDAYYITVSGTQTAPSGAPVAYQAVNWIAYLESGVWEQFTFPFAVILTQTVTAGDTTHAPSGNAVVEYVSPIAGDLQTQINNKADRLGLTPFNTPNLGNLTFNLTVNADGQVTSINAITISIDSTNITDFATAVGNLITGKADKIIPAAPGNFASLSSTGNLQDGGAAFSLDAGFTSANNITFPSTLAVKTFVNAGLATKVNTSLLGAANGVATLDAGGKVPASQLPATASNYLGAWNAAANTPFVTAGVGSNGDWYSVTVSGTQTAPSGTAQFYEVDSSIIYNGSIWVYNPPTAGVISVNGLTGAVTLTTDQVAQGSTNLYWSQALFNTAFNGKTTTNLVEGANLYFTNARVQSYIASAAAAATTSQAGTVQLMTGATTKLVPDQTLFNTKANIASPTFTGVPAAPTATAGTNTTQLATTAFVQTVGGQKQNLITSPVANNIATMNASGQTINSSKLFSDTANLVAPSTTRIITELGLSNMTLDCGTF
jgi:hypothetical protein